LDNLVFQDGDRERALPAVRLGNVLSPGWQRNSVDPLAWLTDMLTKLINL
jgi:hypothetical protein